MSEQVIISFDFPGVQEGERAVKMLSQLQATMAAGKGSGKALEEIRKAMVGLRGQASVFEDLRDAVGGLNSAADSIKNSFGKSIKDLSRIVKQEFAELRAVVNNASAEIGKSAGAGMSKAMEQATTQGTKNLKSKMKRDLQEMQAALESELGKGVKFSAKDFGDFKAWGLNIGMDAKQGIREGLISERGRGSAIDVKTILGLSDQLVRKSAKDSASVFTAAFAAEAGRGKDTFREFSAMMGLDNSKVAKSARDSAAVFNAAYAAEQKKFNQGVQNQVKAATIQATGPYSNINTGQLMNMPKADEVDKLSGAFKRLTVDGNDAHSMARGLASGFNALWLTWGNLLPLFAGAGISFGLKKTFDIGSEVEYNIKFMEVLGQTTKEQGKIIREQLRAIDQTTMFSLTELSKGLVTLGQAGLAPAEALKTLKAGADLAAAGMTDLDTATNLLIQTNALFGLSNEESATTAAKLFKITKEGVLNVQDIGGSMKYASEANTRFGKSLEETLAALGVLAQSGIKQASAGTVYINFLRDINGRSGPAIAALKQLNEVLERNGKAKLEVFKADGSQVGIVEMFTKITEAAKLLKNSEADKILARLFSDRGGRLNFAMFREGVEDMQKTIQGLKDVKPELLIDAAKGMMDTAKGAVELLKGGLVGTLDQVFEQYSEQFKTFIKDVTAVVSSNEFRAGVAGMVGAVGSLYDTVKMLLPMLTALGAAWAVFKAASIGVAIFQALATGLAGLVTTIPAYIAGTVAATSSVGAFSGALAANGTALIGQAAASKVATAGMTDVAAASARAAAASTATAAVSGRAMGAVAAGVGLLSNPITGIIVTLGLLGLAFWDMKKDADAAVASTTDGIIKNGQVNMAQWDKEIAKLRERNRMIGDSFSPGDDTLRVGREQQQALQKQIDEKRAKVNGFGGKAFTYAQAQEINQLNKLQTQYVQKSRDLNKIQEDVSKSRFDAERRREEEAAKRAKKNALQIQGDQLAPKAPGRPGFDRGPTTDFAAFKLAQDNTLAELQKGVNQRLTTYKTMYDQEKQLMDAEFSNKLMSEGTYQAKVTDSTRAFEATTLADLRKTNQEIYDAYGDRYAEIENLLAKANAANKNGSLDSVVEKLNQDLENLDNTVDGMVNGNLEKIFQTQTVAANRFQLATVSARGELEKLKTTTNEYWAKNDEALAQAKALQKVEDQYASLNESVFSLDRANKAAALAAVQELSRHQDHMRMLTEEVRKAEVAYVDYKIAALEAGPPTEEQVAELVRLREKVSLLNQVATASGANVQNAADGAAALARDKQIKQQIADVNAGLTDAIETAIFEGGKEGGKKMRDFLQNELLRKPLRVILSGAINSITGGLMGNSSGGGGGGLNFQGVIGGLANLLGGSNPSSNNPTSPDFVGPQAPDGVGTGGLGTISNIASIGQTAYNLYNGTGPLAAAWKGISTWAGSLTTSTTAVTASTSVVAIETAGAATSAASAAAAAAEAASIASAATAAAGSVPVAGAAAAATANPGMFLGMGPAGWVMLIVMALANAMGIFRKKSIIGAGLQGTLGDGSKLTAWEEHKRGGSLFSGSSFETKDPLAIYKSLREQDLETIKALKAGGLVVGTPTQAGTTATFVGSPYDRGMAGASITAGGTTQYSQDMEDMAWRVEGQSNAINMMYNDTRSNVVKMANGLGLFGDKVKDFTFKLDQQDLNFMDLDEDEIQEKLTAAMGKAGTAMAKDLLGTWITETVDVVRNTQLTQLTNSSDASYEVAVDQVTRTRYVASEFAKAGETSLETLTRLYNSFQAVNNAADAMGYGVFQASLGVAAAADTIVEAFGGLEAFMQTTSAFINNFFTAGQKKDATARMLSRDLGALGITATEDQLKGLSREDMVSAVLSLGSDPKLQSEVMKLVNGAAALWPVVEDAAPAVSNLATAADSAADALNELYRNAMSGLLSEQAGLQVELARAMGNETKAREIEKSNFMAQYAALDAARQIEIATLYDLNVATKDLINSYKTMHSDMRKVADNKIEAAVNATDKAMATLERSVDKERKVLEKQKEDAQERVNNLQAIFDMLGESVTSLYATINDAVVAQAKLGREVIRNALATGVIPDQKTLTEAIANSRAAVEQDIYGSTADSDFAKQVLAGELKQLQEVTGVQLSTEQLALKAATDGLVYLDRVIELAREEIDKLRNVDQSVKDVGTAISELAKALKVEYGVRTQVNSQLLQGKGSATYDLKSKTGTNDEGVYFTGASMVQAAQDTIAWGIATGNGVQAAQQIYDVILGSGYSMEQAAQILGVDKSVLTKAADDLGMAHFDVGTNYVPSTGIAMLHEGEAVIPAEHNPWTGNGNDESETARLLREVLVVLGQINVGSNNTSLASQKTADLLENVTENGAGMRNLD